MSKKSQSQVFLTLTFLKNEVQRTKYDIRRRSTSCEKYQTDGKMNGIEFVLFEESD